MSIFSSRTTQTLPLPGDDPHTVTIRRLSGRHLQAARDAWQAAAVAAFETMGGKALQEGLSALGDAAAIAARVAEAVKANPTHGFDRAVLILKGVVALSEEPAYATWTAEAKAAWYEDELSEDAADFLARAILDLTMPARDAAGKKTAPDRSTAP